MTKLIVNVFGQKKSTKATPTPQTPPPPKKPHPHMKLHPQPNYANTIDYTHHQTLPKVYQKGVK